MKECIDANLCSCETKASKISGFHCIGFESLTPAITVQCSTN